MKNTTTKQTDMPPIVAEIITEAEGITITSYPQGQSQRAKIVAEFGPGQTEQAKRFASDWCKKYGVKLLLVL